MNLPDFFDEILDVLGAADIGLTIPDDDHGVRVSPPAPYIELPEIVYGEPGPGLHRLPDITVAVIFGPANNPTIFRQALAYASPSGALSVRAALESHTWVSVGTVYVKRAEPTYDTIQGSGPQVGYNFHLDVTGG